MKLVDTEIRRALDSGVWKAYRDGEPIGSADLQIGPNSVDVTLGGEIITVSGHDGKLVATDCAVALKLEQQLDRLADALGIADGEENDGD